MKQDTGSEVQPDVPGALREAMVRALVQAYEPRNVTKAERVVDSLIRLFIMYYMAEAQQEL